MQNQITYTQEKAAELKKAKEQVINRFDLNETAWNDLLIETGCRFAEMFSRLFPNKLTVSKQLLQESPDEGAANNFFWQWWMFKWLQDDMAFVQSCMYYSSSSYKELKEELIGNETLEIELLNLYNKTFK